MRVLVLAPHPFYQERGTPIAVDLLLRALSERGDRVDLLTFPEGEDRTHPQLTVHRIRSLPGTAGIRPGFSWKKVLCDGVMFVELRRMLGSGAYDVVHAMEESGFLAMWTCRPRKVPFIYDMDSSLSEQLTEKYRATRLLGGFFRFMESRLIKSASVVVPMCDRLADTARRFGARSVHVLKDISLVDGSTDDAVDLRVEFQIQGKIVMYIGNLESYQGIDLLLSAFARVAGQEKDVTLVVIGGAASDVAHYRERAGVLDIAERVVFTGPRPVRDLHGYVKQADVLASPRTQGTNTPMKIYSYLHSGVAVLATDLPTHTQVVDRSTAMLARPDPEDFAAAMRTLLHDDALRARLATAARALIEREHVYPVLRRRIDALYDEVARAKAPAGAVAPARPV